MIAATTISPKTAYSPWFPISDVIEDVTPATSTQGAYVPTVNERSADVVRWRSSRAVTVKVQRPSVVAVQSNEYVPAARFAESTGSVEPSGPIYVAVTVDGRTTL